MSLQTTLYYLDSQQVFYGYFFLVYRDFKSFYEFVDKVETPAGVGGDDAEDVMGGLYVAVNKLQWRDNGTKVSALTGQMTFFKWMCTFTYKTNLQGFTKYPSLVVEPSLAFWRDSSVSFQLLCPCQHPTVSSKDSFEFVRLQAVRFSLVEKNS